LVELEVEGAGNVKSNGAALKPEAKKAEAKPEPKADAPKPKPAEAAPAKSAPASVQAFTTRTANDKPLASPAVRQRAHELGIALQFVPGTGPAGRISHADLDAFVASGGRSVSVRSGPAPRDGVEQVKVIGLRRKIAEKMQDSKRRIPHFAYVEEIDMTE